MVLITHNREEALSLADEVVFLQKGKAPLVGKEARKRLEGFSFGEAGGGVQAGSENAASRESSSFLGKSATQVNSKKSPIFAVKNLWAYETPLSRIENLSFAVEAGKITCVKGQWETGLSLLEDVVSGMKTFSKGEIFFAGKWYKEKDKFDTRLLRQKGTSIIPSDKINRGAPKSLKVEELFLVAKQNQGKNLFQGKDLISQAKVDAKLSNKVSSLSGGMLQRLILRRELSLGSDFYIFSNPTSGLDFAGIRYLISTLKNLTEKGKGILVLSVDDTEIEKICDFCIALDWKTDLEKNRK